MLMAPNSQEFIIFLNLIVFYFLRISSSSTERDILCLRSIKVSLQDPSYNLLSWNFSNNPSWDSMCQFSGVYCRYPDIDTDVIETLVLSNNRFSVYFVLTLYTMTFFISYCVPCAHVKEAKDLILATTRLLMKNAKKKAAQDSSEVATMQLLQIPMLERMVPRMSFTQLNKSTHDFSIGKLLGSDGWEQCTKQSSQMWKPLQLAASSAEQRNDPGMAIEDQNYRRISKRLGMAPPHAMLMNPYDNDLNMPRGFSINTEFWEWDFVKKNAFDFGIVLLELIRGEDPSKQPKSKERFIGNILANQELV
ncbi:hypothetical protein DITRI_Ditri15bG0010800 [Diplodiscus trichospermus]